MGIEIGSIVIPDHELEFSFARSSGPGGQNVNKVNSKVILRWHAVESGALRPEVLARLASQLTNDGDLVITSDRYRDQPRNREDCIEKLRALLLAAATPPRPRKKTRPTRSSAKRRLAGKKARSDTKRLRGRVED